MKSRRLFGERQWHCKLCVKNEPASLKSVCVNKITEFTFHLIPLGKRNHCQCKNSLSKFARFNQTARNRLSATKTNSAD